MSIEGGKAASEGGTRARRLTEKAQQNYEEKTERFTIKLIKLRRLVEEIIMRYHSGEKEKTVVGIIKKDLDEQFKEYEVKLQKYIQFLANTNTAESAQEMDSQNTIHRTVSEDVVKTLHEIEMILKNIERPASEKPVRSSHHSSRHDGSVRSRSSVISQQRAKAVVAKAKLEFELKEAELQKEKARLEEEQLKMKASTERKKSELEADLKVLDKQRDVVVTEVELKAYEEESYAESEQESLLSKEKVGNVEHFEAVPKPFSYVQTPLPKTMEVVDEIEAPSLVIESGLNPMAQPFKSSNQYSDLSSYLLKRDLLIERFYKYDDKPETFNIWKTSFRSILSDLNATPAEEFDLLSKYLGPESKVYACAIRQANANNLKHGVELVWERLHERFGSPELIEKSLKQRLEKFPKITAKDNSELYKLSDLCNEIKATKEEPKYSQLLSYFDSSTGVRPIVEKLPLHIQSKWASRASNYKRVNDVYFPPFSEFCAFLKEMSVMLNDPGLCVSYTSASRSEKQKFSDNRPRAKVHVNKTITDVFVADSCPFHGNTTSHNLNDCKTFKGKSVSERKRFLKDKNICYKCCNANSHNFKTCSFVGRCNDCGSDRHPSALHYFQPPNDQQRTPRDGGKGRSPPKDHGREQLPTVSPHEHPPPPQNNPSPVVNGCTNVCGKGFTGKSCSKTVLVKVHPAEHPEKAKMMYCIIDDQSNRTLCRTELFQMWNADVLTIGVEDYDLVSCSGRSVCSGRTLSNLTVASLDNSFSVTLSDVLECDRIPNTRSEIPTPEVTQYHEHLKGIPIPQLQPEADIILLIGRDVPEAHHVYEQRIAVGRPSAPFAQRLGFGWVIIGEVCLNSHKPDVQVMKTYIHDNGRPSLFEPCDNKLTVKTLDLNQYEAYDNIFVETKNDNKPGLSVEDKEFVKLMDREFRQDETGHWSAPLPFRTPRVRLPRNRDEAYRRAKSFDASLKRDPQKRQHSMDFMGNLLDKGHAELAPPLQEEECWYLPLFGVYHPKIKDKIRIVFDSSSKSNGVSLNSVLMSGPDLTNNLTGILMRFRKEKIAITGDIEQMFYQFRVNENHRDYLRFLWYEDNGFNKPLVDYRMCVHVFGNSPSPAVATYGLRKAVHVAAEKCDNDVVNFVDNDFYVDDGLTSVSTHSEAVDLVRNTQRVLEEEGKLRFHKIASNSLEVLRYFPESDLAKDLKHTQIGVDSLPVQRSLGLCWDLNEDCFIFQMSRDKTGNYTKRSVLSVINSLFDPLGFLSPFTITGKLLLRDITSEVSDWDEPLPEYLSKEWETWVQSLPDLESLKIPRVYFSEVKFNPESQLHVFCDASQKAIASVAFLKTVMSDEDTCVAYVFGKTKVAPKHGHTIPRLELCAAVLAVEIAETISEELSISPDKITYHSDSKVVLGYLNNKTRRFFVYVENRVSRILKFSKSSQWRYIETSKNPADEGTRGIKPSELTQCSWLSGKPLMLLSDNTRENHELQYPDEDVEVRASVKSMKTEVRLGINPFEKFSDWKRLILAFTVLIHFIKRMKKQPDISGRSFKTEESKSNAQEFVIKQVQREAFPREIDCLTNNRNLPKDSHVLNLSPFLDEHGILRIGGRLKNSQLSKTEKNPILIPGRSHAALLLVRHYHEEVHHQGRHITEGVVRAAGFWITGGKRLIGNYIYKCVTCRKLRGQLSIQKMSDLPADRLTPAPPFTFVGVDVFGPWNVVTRRTRGGSSSSKRWAVLFTCLTIRAVHIEIIDEMSSSAFINALRRFVAIRGNVKVFRSDRGTNFVGATDDLDIDAVNVEDKRVKNFLYNSGSTWVFNPPHASHMGGAWERMIGVTRRILDAILLENKHKHLTHDVLTTFMAEVCAIVNARPITPVSTDPENPFLLSPSVLLTHKTSGSSVDSFQHLDVKDMYKAQWKCVQVLAEIFWKRWQSEYLSQLQSRKIWQKPSENIKTGDVVLLREKSVVRNDWPVGLVTQVYASDDGLVRKCAIKIIKDNKPTEYIRPIVELVKLLE